LKSVRSLRRLWICLKVVN